jgi:hypothetical protein
MEFYKLTIGTTLVLQFPQATVNLKNKNNATDDIAGLFLFGGCNGLYATKQPCQVWHTLTMGHE